MDDEELAARLADDVAEAGDVHPVAAVEDAEAEVEVPLHAQRPPAVEAEGVAGELDRVEVRLAVADRDGDVGRVERRLGRRREPEDVDEPEVDRERAEVPLGDVGLARPLEGPQVVAQAVQGDPAGEQAAERLLAREGLGVALEVGPLQLDRRGVLRGWRRG